MTLSLIGSAVLQVVERHGAGRERLVVRVPEEHVTLSVVMETGTLVIQVPPGVSQEGPTHRRGEGLERSPTLT